MIKKRVVSTLLWDGVSLVKGRSFSARRTVGALMQAIRVCERRDVDELVLLDVAATPQGRGPFFEELKEYTGHCFMPMAIGGGVSSCQDIEKLLRAGADKAVIGSKIFDRDLIKRAAKRFGRQALVAAIDVGNGKVITECGSKINDISPVDLAKSLAKDGVGEILLTSIDAEGALKGFDCDLIGAVSKAVSIPVVASGGAGTPEHVLEAFRAGADAVAVGAMFLFTEATPISVRRYLHEHGIPVRLE